LRERPLRSHAARLTLGALAGLRVALVHAEEGAFGIFAVGVPAGARDGVLGHHHLAAVGGDAPQIGGYVVNAARVDRAHERAARLEEAAIDAGLVVGAGDDEPIVFWPLPLSKLPTEYIAVEVAELFGVAGGDFEVHRARHGGPPFQAAIAGSL